MKRIIKILVAFMASSFLIINITWLFFYFDQKHILKQLMEKHEMINEFGNVYRYSEDNLSYVFVLPDYMYFKTSFQVVENYDLYDDAAGDLFCSKKYHVSLLIKKYFWEENWFYIEVDPVSDEEGKFIEHSICERIDYYPDFKEKKVWTGLSDKDVNDVREFFTEANDEITFVYNKAIDFFGDKYLK